MINQNEGHLEQAIEFMKSTGEVGKDEQTIQSYQEQQPEPELQEAIHFVSKEEKDAEMQQYLLLYIVEEDGKEIRTFEWITGRRKIYDFLVPMIKESSLDCRESTVIVEGSPIEFGVSVYRFMKLMEKRFPEETFNIDNYVDPDDFDDSEGLQ